MTLRVAIQMDPIGSIKPKTDSTRLLALEAQARGHKLYYYTPDKLSWREGTLYAAGWHITFHTDDTHYYDLGEPVILDLKHDTDVILLRQNPPFDMGYITSTYFLGQLHPKPLVLNNPNAVRDLPEKLFPTLLSHFMPPTLISTDRKELDAFFHRHKDVVIKPLYSFSGSSVFRLREGDSNYNAMIETLVLNSREPWVMQRFLPEITDGDRRITFIDGKPTGTIARVPGENEIRSNFGVGGHGERAELSPRQQEICDAIGPMLKENGLYLAGLDLIGDYLIEVNITSPATMIIPNRELYGLELDKLFWDGVEAKF